MLPAAVAYDLDVADDWEQLETELVTGAKREASFLRFRLVVLNGPAEGTKIVSTGERTTIGTHESADVRLDDRAVSRVHAELIAEGGRVTLRDLGSRNGTFVDGVSVEGAHLSSGCLLRVGRTELRFELEDGRIERQLAERASFGRLVGRSLRMREMYAVLERAARSDTTVLIQGETGTGKELVAESIHRESERRDGPFIVVDCGSIPGDLLDSELFGHEAGAFTGATSARRGAFEEASSGTVFLDEIGELPLELQPRLLRVLERREVKRVGASTHRPVDVRIVAATHRALADRVNEKLFRSDLYFRLAVIEVRIPPLRDRREDLPLLVDRLLEGLDASPAVADALKSGKCLVELARYRWPGNVRELRNYLERAVVLRDDAPRSPRRKPEDDAPALPQAVDLDVPLKRARDEYAQALERLYLQGILARHDGNVTAAAKAAGVDRIYFYRLLWKHGLR